MELLKSLKVKCDYITSGWDSQNHTRYVFGDGNVKVEASMIECLRNGIHFDNSIEISTSYGCPMKCKFCASAQIDDFQKIDSDELVKTTEYIMKDNRIDTTQEPLFIPLFGIGDIYYTLDNAIDFIKKINERHPNLSFGLSSIKLTPSTLNALERLKKEVDLKKLQITYVGNNEVTKCLVPGIGDDYDFSEIIAELENSSFNKIDVTHIGLRNQNDAPQDLQYFVEQLAPIDKRAHVRVTRSNPTATAESHGLEPASGTSLHLLKTMLDNRGIQNKFFYPKQDYQVNCGQLIADLERK